MAIRRVKVMLSSRCRDAFPKGGPSLTQTRSELKAELEGISLLGEQLFDVWINELAPAAEGSQDSWDTCLREVRDSDILIVLSNGNAGWSARAGDVGICHAELMTGLNTAAAKVRLISLGNISPGAGEQSSRNRRFQSYVATQSLFRAEVATVDELKERVREALVDALTSLAALGTREARRGRYYTGEALAWSKLDFATRQKQIRDVLIRGFVDNGAEQLTEGAVRAKFGQREVLLVVNAIPGALSVSAAREMIGRPFLKDHEFEAQFGSAVGPVHVIGCHQTATEAQARQFLGFPDATVVAAPFGVYVADDVQGVQFVFLQNCRDETMVRHALQRLLEWLEQSGEVGALVDRARSRRRIVSTIAKEAQRRKGS
jgi:hypothetical protein